MRRMCILAFTTVVLGALILGCPPDYFPEDVAPTRIDIDRITSNSDLTVNERREELIALGLSPEVVNALLSDQRTGNQYGGDLRSAYNKVSGDQLTSLTPDEVQIYADEAGNVDDTITASFSDLEAADLVQWLRVNDLASRDALEAALDDGNTAATVPTSLSADDIRAVFVDFDPDRLIDRLP